MATYIHGKKAAVVHGGLDLSPWLKEAKASASMETGDTSHFGSGAKTYILGQSDAVFSGSGMYDSSVGAIQPHMNAVITTEKNGGPSVPFTFAPEGLKIGAVAIMALSKTTSYEVNSVISDIVSLSFNMQANGGMGFGAIVALPAPITTTTIGATVDNLAATTNGGRVFLHVLSNANSGNVTGTLQHSTNGTVWVDLAVLPVVTTGTTSAFRTLEFAGTVNRYLRFTTTLAGTGAVSVTASASRN